MPIIASGIEAAMISIRKTITDLDESRQQRDLAFDCYLAAIRNTAHYAIELEDSITSPHRRHLASLAEEVAKAADCSAGDLVTGKVLPAEVLDESRATFRGLLRDYRDKASQYLSELREQLASTARALQQIVESLAQTDGDHDRRMRSAIGDLRQAAESPEGEPLRVRIVQSVDTIQQSLEEARREQRITVAQFQTEITMLHKRIHMLETAASVDALTKLFTRREMEDRIRKPPAAAFSLLLIKVNGFRAAELNFSAEVAAELTSAFSRRLRNSLPEDAVIGRWSEEEFIALTHLPRQAAVNLATHIAEHLSGPYACLLNGRTVRPALELRVGTVDSAGDSPEHVLQKIAAVLTGQA
jgi:GGDEF domain-containing protein